MSIGKEKHGILLESNSDIAVYGLNQVLTTTDAYLALPTDILGTRYLAVGSEPSSNIGTQYLNLVSIIAVEDNTTVSITPKNRIRVARNRFHQWIYHDKAEPFVVNLNKLESYTIRSVNDITGAFIESDKSVSVISGHECAYVPDPVRYCDHLIEQVCNIAPSYFSYIHLCDYNLLKLYSLDPIILFQIPPISTWGSHFAVVPLATRRGINFIKVNANSQILATNNKNSNLYNALVDSQQ